MGEGRIGSFTQPVEHEAELKLQGEFSRSARVYDENLMTRFERTRHSG